MRVPLGTRAQIAKLITDIEKIDDPDIVYEYVRDIASFYTSDNKTDERILIQHEKDIKVLVNLYNVCSQFYYGHEPQYEFDITIKPDARYKQAVINCKYALEFLIYEAAANMVFLSIDKLEKLGLKNIKRKTIKFHNLKEVSYKGNTFAERLKEFRETVKDATSEYVDESFYDYAINFYKMNGYIFEYPEIPKELQKIFNKDKKLYWDICNQCKGKNLESVAQVYSKAESLNKSNAMRPFLRHFVTRLIDPNMSKDEETKYYQQFRRALGLK